MKKASFCVSLLFFIFSLPVFVLSFFPITRTIYQLTNAQQNQTSKLSSMSEDLLRQTLEYLGNSEKTYQLNIQKPADFQLTKDEQSHMSDVKYLFFVARMILFSSFSVSMLIFFLTSSSQKKELFVHMLSTIKYFLLILVFLSLLTLLFWNQTFTTFHQVFFPQGNWAFPADSLIIQLFPDQFWWGMGMGYLTIIGFALGIVWFLNSTGRRN